MENQGPNLSTFFRRGGIFYAVPGAQPRSVLVHLTGLLPGLADREELLQAVFEREDLMPTAMGNGIALPHPRNPVIHREEAQFAALAFPENPLDWAALDGKPVHSVILIVSASAKAHLSVLQRITFFCRDGEFCRLLESRAPAEDILGYVEKTETGWI
ncbi:MAG: PTS sugar transporter subunit IIA [Treponema sp.]|jgi:PTS system nitrogen regulatory IIA component|nr:PTS sugar transporter subunit IIA [Treponema sp.]